MSTKKERGLISYRTSLLFVVPALVILTGALIAGNSYITTRGSIARLADSVFEQAASQAAEQAHAHVSQAAPAADLLASILIDPSETDEIHALAENLLAVLRANAGFAWVSYSTEQGAFTGVERRADGSILLNHSVLKGAKTITDESIVGRNNSLTPLRHQEDGHYDPRKRPYYELAKIAGKRVWTEPYVFYDEGVPGITCAEPVYGTDGVLRGIVTVDFDLNVLSDFVAHVHASDNARVFVYTKDGTILAHPTAKVVVHGGDGDKGTLVTKDNIKDDVVRSYFGAKGKNAFEYQGERWFAATREFPSGDDLSWSVGAVAPESDFMGGVDRTTRFSLGVSLTAVLFAVLFAAALSGRIARPLASLSAEMERVGRFEIAEGDPPSSMFREIAAMNRALTAMKSGLRSFSFYVPRDLVRAVLASGEHAELGGKTKHMTIFFSDLAGFTSIAEKLSPEELVQMLGSYFDEMTKVIAKENGTVDKFIGDAIMAFWNAPVDDEDHAASAAVAALLCMRKLDEIKQGRPELKDLAARIGVATGDVVVGNIGSHDRMNYTVMGDTTNLASRLEGLNKVYNTLILVSERTYEEAHGRLVMRAVDVVAVKGKKKGVRVFEPLALADENDENAIERARISILALDAYRARRFTEAVALYDQMIALAPNDRAALLMRDRAKGHIDAPPPSDWDGVMIAMEK